MGDAALQVQATDAAEARRLAAEVRRRPGEVSADRPTVLDVVPGLASVLVTVDLHGGDGLVGENEAAGMATMMESLAEWLAHLVAHDVDEVAAVQVHEIPVIFDGPDLVEVAEAVGCSTDGLIELLTGRELTVEVLGFSPGFGYLSGLPAQLAKVPRRSVPRPAVPAGSLALAGGFAAIYPHSTPGGWNLLGRTTMHLFDPAAPPFAVLRAGDRVRFIRADDDVRAEAGGERHAGNPKARRTARAPLTLTAGAREGFVVERSGLLTTVQDGGRVGVAHLGVPRAGPLDPVRHGLSNRLVGNRAAAAALEITAEGPALRCRRAVHVAVVGGEGVVVDVDGREVPIGSVVPVAAGQRLSVGRIHPGLRAYLSVAGGFEVERVMGSASSDLLSGVGVGALGVGDLLGVGEAVAGSLSDHLMPGSFGAAVDSATRVRVLPGPHPEWFGARVMEALEAAMFEVLPSSDRVGLRLGPVHGAGRDLPGSGSVTGVIERSAGELDPQGMVTGAIQVPPSGLPVVLLADHATVGGYPVVAVVVSADLGELGQCRPGDRVTFEVVDIEEAHRASIELHRRMHRALAGHYPLDAG